MGERLLLRALRSGKSRTVILRGKKLQCIPQTLAKLSLLRVLDLRDNLISHLGPGFSSLTQGLCRLRKLKILDLAGNQIHVFPSAMQELQLQELYCEENPLLQKRPLYATQIEEVWTLKEITARFIMDQLDENDSVIKNSIKYYPEARNMLSQGKECPVCGKHFLSIWLECVYFQTPNQNMKISKNANCLPIKTLLCSYTCFKNRGPGIYGIV
ncbi:leucine-rich repeat-containing protein 69 isoform X3 [Ornithorhynchus anatinus]|uniref:leucine-rich repeat-containing protein 69 isoform X3 n=1 Tax=Ornithorhynchus anatinus TaxID=9258 RepID=UPI0010A8C5CD|nr:leucine-rich repeat-containing protein 69 isoform X3 [Ornithorhynchus anatinus]